MGRHDGAVANVAASSIVPTKANKKYTRVLVVTKTWQLYVGHGHGSLK
jgi:hypothetical protein